PNGSRLESFRVGFDVDAIPRVQGNPEIWPATRRKPEELRGRYSYDRNRYAIEEDVAADDFRVATELLLPVREFEHDNRLGARSIVSVIQDPPICRRNFQHRKIISANILSIRARRMTVHIYLHAQATAKRRNSLKALRVRTEILVVRERK